MAALDRPDLAGRGFDVVAQVRCLIRRGSGAIDMAATSADFGVEALPLARWLNGHDWDVA